jgi:para-nitrobenzyl esterase
MKNMKYKFKTFVSAILITFMYSCSDTDAIGTSLKVEGGQIEGTQNGSLKKFAGIPYAAAPVGNLRWAPPQLVESWIGVRDASLESKICHQPIQPTEFYNRGPDKSSMSEDCLTLNVWTRAEKTEENLPVMVWIHGGALVWGSGSEYKGDQLTKRGIILVTVNYRLGPLGFYAHPELNDENGGRSGNQGYRDQIAALQWVKNNIKKFGGDPNNVTIFGESAGSWSINVLQASPLSKGLFHKAIGQSGARLLPLTHLTMASDYSDSASQLGVVLAETMSGKENTSLEQLRNIAAEEIIRTIEEDKTYSSSFDSLTIIDGEVLPEAVSAIFLKGNQADVPVLIGSTADEATTFDPVMLNPEAAKFLKYVDLTKASINQMLPNVDKKIFEYYPTTNEAVAKDSWVSFTTDAMFTAPMQDWGNLMSTVDSPAYLYIWDHHPKVNGTKEFKAFHAADVPYVFGGMGMFDIDFSEEDLDLSNSMMDIWTNFAKTGNPSLPEKFVWPAFEASTQKYISLGTVIEEKQNLRSQKVALINKAYERSRVDFN